MRVARRCPVDGRGWVLAIGSATQTRTVVEMAAKFADAHEVCTVELAEESKPHRCGNCGLKLLFGDRCPVHPGSERVRWSDELRTAYTASVEALAAGTRLSVPIGHQGDAFVQARRLMERWGQVVMNPNDRVDYLAPGGVVASEARVRALWAAGTDVPAAIAVQRGRAGRAWAVRYG